MSDPQAFCAWMEEEEKTGKITPGDKVIWGAEVEFMSLVSTPAVTDSEFLMIKEKAKDPSKIMVKGMIPLLRRKSQDNPDDRIVYAPALIPDKADGNREAIPKEEIKKAAIKYMETYRKVDNEHTFMDGDGIPIFSWILQKDEALTTMSGKEKIYPEGSWMMGIKVTSDKVWEMIKSGERTGFSIAGSWKVLEIKSKGKKDVIDFFIETPPRSDADVHAYAESIGMSPDVVEGEIYDLLNSFLTGGASGGNATVEELATKHGVTTQVINEQLKLGVKIEMEHTSEPRLALKIAMDHVIEMPDYYDKLIIMEESKSSSEKELSISEVKTMEEEEFMKLFEKAYTAIKQKEAEEQGRKEADDEKAKLKADLEAVKKELAEMKASKDSDAPPAEDGEKADDVEDEEEDEEKEEYEDEEEDEEEKKLEQKATKSYDSKIPEKKPEKPKQEKALKNAKITVKREPLGDINHA